MKNRKPDVCSSFACDELGCDYCKQCSHAYYHGETKIGNVTYYWEFNPYHGPYFKRSTSKDEYYWIPNERHKVWSKFHDWLDKLQGE